VKSDWPKNKIGGYVAIPYIIEGIVVAASAAGTVEGVQASRRQAEAASQAADYNAKLDQSEAQQLSLNAQANIQRQRQQDATYQSDQRAALAASGVLSDEGSPMVLQATTAGRQEQDVQTYWTSVQEKESQLYSSAAEGEYEGQEEADIYHLQGAADIFSGIGSIAGSLGKFAGSQAGPTTTDDVPLGSSVGDPD
jgi:hypothetical protein